MRQRPCPARRRRGTSLPEIVVVLLVVALLVTLAAPGLGGLRDRTVVTAQAESLRSALRRARHEAMTRGETVSACALAPGSAAAGRPGCAPGGTDWSAGWLVFADRGERGEVGAADRLLLVHQAPASAGPVVATTRYLSFRGGGALLSLAAHFRVLPPGRPARDEAQPGSVLVCVNKVGRPRLAEGPDCG